VRRILLDDEGGRGVPAEQGHQSHPQPVRLNPPGDVLRYVEQAAAARPTRALKARGIRRSWPAIAAALMALVLLAGTYVWRSGLSVRMMGAPVNASHLSITSNAISSQPKPTVRFALRR
jgi:hypothetical protein